MTKIRYNVFLSGKGHMSPNLMSNQETHPARIYPHLIFLPLTITRLKQESII